MQTPPEREAISDYQDPTATAFSNPPMSRVLPFTGCFGIMLVAFSLCIMPLFLVDAMRTALERLHLTPPAAVIAVGGILLGSVMNIPVYRFSRGDVQLMPPPAMFGISRYPLDSRQTPWETIVAVNVGGCVIPALLALWQVGFLFGFGRVPLLALLVVSSVNVAVCYFASRPISGLGIVMPGLVSPMTAVCTTWLLLNADVYEPARVSVAFVAGVLGPLIGADLLHLRDLKSRVAVSMLSIGGAGTFDGIILSGIVAALFA